MNRSFIIVAASAAITVIAIIAIIYVGTFGLARSYDHAVWGAFGDYFGGILNPIFALFAFLGVLWSLDLQMKQVKQLSKDKQADEILQVVKDIDTHLHELSKIFVGTSSGHEVLINHMAAESRRIHELSPSSPNFLSAEDSYLVFLKQVASPGSLVGMAVREMADLISRMSAFLERYPLQPSGEYTPIIEHYRTKTFRLVPMLKDANMVSESTRAFFETVR